MNILLLPKDGYPFRRVRLNQLFMTYFATGEDHVFWVAYGEDTEHKVEGNNNIHLLRSSHLKGIGGHILSRSFAYRKFGIGRKVIKTNSIDLIVSNDGVFEGIMGYILSRMYKKKFVFYLSSLFLNMEWSELRSMPSIISVIKTVKASIKQPFYSWIIKRSDVFHPISESMGRYYANKGVPADKIYSLPLCPAKSMIEAPLHRDRRRGSPFSMIYIGQITPVRKIDFLMDIAHEIKNSTKTPFKILIVGKIFRESYRELLINKIKDLSLTDEVQLVDEVPFEKVKELVDESDLGLSILPPILAYRVSSPTKVVEYLSRGIPVIANREIEDQRDIIERSGGGIAPPYSMPAIVSAIREIMSDIEKGRNMGMRGRDWLLKNRNYGTVVSDLKRFYEQESIH